MHELIMRESIYYCNTDVIYVEFSYLYILIILLSILHEII